LHLSKRLTALFWPAAIAAVAMALYAPMLWRQSHVDTGGDYMMHGIIAQLMWKNGVLLVPHPMLHWLMIAIAAVTKIHVVTAGWIVTTIAMAAVPVIVFLALERSLGRGWALAVAAISVLAHPIVLFTLSHLYVGYIVMTTYHSPTMILMKPMAFLLFLTTVYALKGNPTSHEIWIAALLTIVTTLTKPSYTIVLLPALGCLVLMRLIKHEDVPWRFLLYGIALPSALLITWQIYVTYVSPLPNFDSHVVFAPLAAIRARTGHIALKLLLSVAFPAVVIAFYWRAFWRSTPCVLATLQMLFGAAYFYLLGEAGRRMGDINFSWSANIAMAILFLVCLYLVLKEWRSGNRSVPKLSIVLLVLLLHSASGVVWYLSEFNPPNQSVWY
jgi:hypothetical protein